METIDLRSNFNVLGPPEGTEEFVRVHGFTLLQEYSGNAYGVLDMHPYAEAFGCEVNQIALGTGSTEILFALPEILEHDNAVIISPSFWEYGAAVERYGIQYQEVALDTDQPSTTLGEIRSLLEEKPSLVFINNPQNPTSTLFQRNELISLIASFPDSDFVVDETYLPFVQHYERESVSSLTDRFLNLHVIQSFSKFYALPGIRLGALISNPDTIDRFLKQQTPYAISSITEAIAPWLLQQSDYASASRNTVFRYQQSSREIFEDVIGDRMKLLVPSSNFAMLINNDGTASSETISRSLEDEGLYVRDCAEFGSNYRNAIRFVLKNEVIMEKLFKRIVSTL